MRDGAAATVQMESGALDLVFDPPAQDVTRYTTDSHYAVYVNGRSGITGIMNMNTTVPPDQQQALPPGGPLRDQSAALRANGAAGSR